MKAGAQKSGAQTAVRPNGGAQTSCSVVRCLVHGIASISHSLSGELLCGFSSFVYRYMLCLHDTVCPSGWQPGLLGQRPRDKNLRLFISSSPSSSQAILIPLHLPASLPPFFICCRAFKYLYALLCSMHAACMHLRRYRMWLHWRGLVKNIWGQIKILRRNMMSVNDENMCVSHFLGEGTCPGCPHQSLRCMSVCNVQA